MTAKARATAAPPTPAGPIPPPILSMIPTEILRGPVVLFVALSYLVFPALLKTSKETQLGLLALGLGTLLTALDWAAHIHQSAVAFQRRLQKELHARANAVVLDDVLRTVFAPGTGWIATLLGCWVGTAGMYALPLDEEQRVRLFGSGLAEVDGALDAREVLLRPGGLLRLLPEGWGADSQKGGSKKNVRDDGEQNNNHASVPIAVDASVDRNARWEDEPEPVGTMDDSLEMEEEDDSATADALTEGSSDSSASSAPHAHRPLHHDVDAPHRRSAPSTGVSQQQQDPATVAASVLSELVGKMLDRSLASVDRGTVQTVGMASALTLALQLRRSPRARSAVWTMAQGAAALGLAGTAAGALTLSEAKRRRERNVHDAAQPTTSSAPTRGGVPTSCSTGARSSTPSNMPLPTLPFSLIFDSLPSINEVLNDGQLWVQQLIESTKSPAFVRRLLEDPVLRRRLKGFAAVLVMMYFRRRRSQRIAQQRPASGGGLYAS